ncbi:WXG100-like domain-containing protein [Kribbella sp. NPDC055110]
MGFWHPVVEFLGAIVGVDPDDWPGGDEDAIRDYARRYDAIATELRTTVATGCREGSAAIGAAWNGEAGRALSAQVLAYGTDKEFGGAESIADMAADLAQYLRDQADTIARAKAMIIAQIVVGVLMFAIPAGKALSPLMRQAFRQALKKFIHNRARAVLKEAVSALAARAKNALTMTPAKFFRGAALAGVGAGVYGLAPNTAAQTYGVLTGQSGRTTPDGGHADGWDWDETKKYAAIAAVATPIAIATGVGMAKLGGVATRNVSALTGRVPRFVGRRVAGAVTMGLSMPAANYAVTRETPTFEDVWKAGVMGAAVPGGGSHGPAAGVPKGDPVEVAPVRNHSTIGGADHPPPDPPQTAVKPGLSESQATADAPAAADVTASSQTANTHSTSAESRTEAGAATNLNSVQPAAGVIAPEARSAARAATTDTPTSTPKTATTEQHAKLATEEKPPAPAKAATPDKPPSGPDKPLTPGQDVAAHNPTDKPAGADKPAGGDKPTAADRPGTAEKQVVPATGANVAHAPEAPAHPGDHPAGKTPTPEAAPSGSRAAAAEVRDWSHGREHQDEVQRREAEATKAHDEHQRAVDAREQSPSVKETEVAAKQADKELKAAERALEKHEAKYGRLDDSARAPDLRERLSDAETKHSAAHQEWSAAKHAEAEVGNTKVAAEARRISYLTAKLDYAMSRLSPAEIRQLGEGKVDVLKEALPENVSREEALQLAIHEMIHRTEDGWGFALKWTQLQAELALRDDLLVQMMTGEGKTAVAAVALGMIAADRPVHFMTSNRSLSAQAYTKFRKVLEPLGYDVIHVDPAVRYPKTRGRTVYVGDVAAFGWSMGRGHRVPGKDVIVDEVDAVAVELAAQTYTHSSGAAGKASAKTEAEVMLAKRALDSGKFDHADLGLTTDGEPVNGVRPKLTAEGRQKLAELTGVEPTSRGFAKQVRRLENAAQAHWGLHEGRDYIRASIDGKETILIVSKHSGEPLVDRETLLEQRWTDVAQALEARHGLEVRADPSHTNAVKTKELLDSYDHVSGMSGTAKDAERAIRDLYGEDKVGRVVEIDRFNDPKLDVRAPQHFATVEEKYQAIVDQAIADLARDGDLATGRPQAIVVEHNDEVALVERLLTERLEHHQLPADRIRIQKVDAERMAGFIADRTFDAKMDSIWKQAGEPGTITIGNKVLGRGIDIEVHPDAFTYRDRPDANAQVFTVKSRGGQEAAAGGLAVRVGFHDAESPRGTIQALNRAGRQGAPGEASLYASHQDELFRRRPSALEAAVAYHDAPTTAAHNEALRAYTDAAVAHAKATALGETTDTLKAATEALRNAERALPAADYSAAIETAQVAAQQATLTSLGVTHTTATPHENNARTADHPDDTSRSRRVREQPGEPEEPGVPAYRQLSDAGQTEVAAIIATVTANDPVRLEGLRPLLESPWLRALDPESLLREIRSWEGLSYPEVFSKSVVSGAAIAAAPVPAPIARPSQDFADATDFGVRERLPDRLSSAGKAGRLATEAPHSGAYRMTGPDGRDWVVKLYAENEFNKERAQSELDGLYGAYLTGFGPTPYGLVRVTVDNQRHVGVGMAPVAGGLIEAEERDAGAEAIREAAHWRSRVTFRTAHQLDLFGRALLAAGYSFRRDLEYFVDDAGNFRLIDLAGVEPLPDDPFYREFWIGRHHEIIADRRTTLLAAAVENGVAQDQAAAQDDAAAQDEAAVQGGAAAPDPAVAEAFRGLPAYRSLTADQQRRIVAIVAAVTENDAVLLDGLSPLLESPGLQALDADGLLAEIGSWKGLEYADVFGKGPEFDVAVPGSPQLPHGLPRHSKNWGEATDLKVLPTTVQRLSSGGSAGSVATLGEHSGVFLIDGPDGRKWAVKLWPAGRYHQQIMDEFDGQYGAALTGYGPAPYGLVKATIGGREYVGVAMEPVPGGFITASSPDPAAIAETDRWRAAVTFDTVRQLDEYLHRLLQVGYHVRLDLQCLVDGTGNLHPIDFEFVRKLPVDPAARATAIQEHGMGSFVARGVRDRLLAAAVENARHTEPGRARLHQGSSAGMTVEATEPVVQTVRRRMRLPRGLSVRFVVGADSPTLVREYGIEPPDGTRPAYIRMENGVGVVYLSAYDHLSAKDVEASVWHEVIGHYGWRLFSPETRSKILAEVHELRVLDPELSAKINELYADQPTEVRDEEFLAVLAEDGLPPRLLQAWNGLLSTRLGDAFARIGAISNEALEQARREHQLEPLYKILRTLLRAVRQNRPVYDASAVGNEASRDRRVHRDQPRGGVGSIHRSDFRGDGRRTPNAAAVWAAVEYALPRMAAAVATVRDDVRAIALDANRITITLWGGAELTAELKVAGDFTNAGPVRWKRTAESMHWARITLSPQTRDEVVGRALADALTSMLSAHGGATAAEQEQAGRYAEVGYLVDRVEQGEAPYHHRKELRLLLRHLDKLGGQVPPGLEHRVRTVLRQGGQRAMARVDEVEDGWTDPAAFRPSRLPALDASQPIAPDPAVDRFVHRLFQHFAKQPEVSPEQGNSVSRLTVLREQPMLRQFVNWHGVQAAAELGRLDADQFAARINASDQQSVAAAFARLRSLLQQRETGPQRRTATRQFSELANALGVVAHDDLRSALPHDLAAAVADLEPSLLQRVNQPKSLPGLRADLMFGFLETVPAGAASAAVLAGSGRVGLAAAVLAGAVVAAPVRTVVNRYVEAREEEVKSDRRNYRRALDEQAREPQRAELTNAVRTAYQRILAPARRPVPRADLAAPETKAPALISPWWTFPLRSSIPVAAAAIPMAVAVPPLVIGATIGLAVAVVGSAQYWFARHQATLDDERRTRDYEWRSWRQLVDELRSTADYLVRLETLGNQLGNPSATVPAFDFEAPTDHTGRGVIPARRYFAARELLLGVIPMAHRITSVYVQQQLASSTAAVLEALARFGAIGAVSGMVEAFHAEANRHAFDRRMHNWLELLRVEVQARSDEINEPVLAQLDQLLTAEPQRTLAIPALPPWSPVLHSDREATTDRRWYAVGAAAIAGSGVGVAAWMVHSFHLDPLYIWQAAAASAFQPVSFYAKYLRRRMRVKADIAERDRGAEKRAADELDRERAKAADAAHEVGRLEDAVAGKALRTRPEPTTELGLFIASERRDDHASAELSRLLSRLADLDAERQRLLKRYDDGEPTELHELTEVLVAISATLSQYADALHKLGVDPHIRLAGPQDRPLSDSVLHHDPVHARNLRDRTWAPGLHHKPSVLAEDAALIAARIQLSLGDRYGPFSLPQIRSHAATGKLLVDIAADVVSDAERRRTPARSAAGRALAARVEFHRSLTADQARAVPARLLQQEQIPLDWPTYARMRFNAIHRQQAELTTRAAARTQSATTTEAEAAAMDDDAKAKGELAKAARHTAIAAACTTAARQADQALQAWQAYRAQPTAETLQTARDQDVLYEQRRAESLPSKDVLQTATVSGQLPHLTALTNQLNEALAQQNKTFRFTPELLHRTLRAETRRLLSPSGLVLTVGNDPRADVTELTQFELTLDPNELQEVLDHPVLIEEAQLGQLVQGGYSVGTTATQAFGVNGGLKLAPLLSALPDTNPLKVAALVSPTIEYSKNVGLSVTGGATEYGLPGAVEVIQGEIHRFRSSRPRWSWRMRTSAVESWSERHVVAGGAKEDTATLELGISHAYAVGAPTETARISSDERRTDLPEHVATRVDGLSKLADEAIAGLRQRLGSLDRVGHDQLRGLLTEDAPGRLAEATRPGGLTRIITSGGRVVAYAQLETVAVWEEATLLGDSSKDHKVERLRVGFSGTSGGQTFSAGNSYSVAAGYNGTATQDLGTWSWDLGPGGKAGLSTGHDTSVNTGDTAIHPSVQRMQPTVGVKLRLEHTLTIRRVDRVGEFTLTTAGDAVLRMPENDAYRYGVPVPSAAIVLDQDGQPRYDADGRQLLRGDPQPTDEDIQLPVWMHRGFRDGSSQKQEGALPIRGAGPALVQELSGADEALQQFLEHLSAKGLIPNGELGGKDPALAASQLANLERVSQQLARHRLETGYDQAAQEGIVLRLDRHRTGFPPQQHSYRISLRSYTGEARFLGLSTGETVVNLDIGSNTTSRSGGSSRSLPWQAKLGFSDKPEIGQEGSTPEITPSYGRSSFGRFISWATGSTVNRVSLTESTAPVAVFDVSHTIVITEVGQESNPIATVDGSARLSIDSEFCRRGDAEPTLSKEGEIDPFLLRSATFQAIDVGDLVGRLTAKLPELARGDSSALHHLSAFLNPRNLAARPELLTAPYRTNLLITPAPSNVGQALAQRGVTTGRARLAVTTTLLNLRYVGSGHPVIGEINLTLGSSTLTTGTSSSGTGGVGGGDGAVETDGSSYGGSLSGSRSKDKSASSTETQIGGVERLAIRDGEHYQFWADLGVVAELHAIGAEPRAAEVRSGAVMLTLPERDALWLYGMRKLDLPAEKVNEAVERLLKGKLDLPPRTVQALGRRQTDAVQRERLAALLQETVSRMRTNWWLNWIQLHRAGLVSLLDAAMPTAKELIERGTKVRLPDYYDTTMGAAVIDVMSLRDPDGNETDLYREALAAFEDSAPEALDDPVLASGLRGDLAGRRGEGHIDNVLSESGFVTEYPTGDGRQERLRTKLEYVGPITIDGVPDAGGKQNASIIFHTYDYHEQGSSVTGATTYTPQVGGALGEGGSGTAGVATDLGTSTTASSTEQNTRMTRALWNRTIRVTRGFRMTLQVNESEPRILTGELTLLVPASVVNAPTPQAADQGKVTLPRGTVVEGTIARKLFKTVYARLGTPDMLTEEGVRVHRTALENMLSAATRLAAFERIASPEGHTMVQLPVPGRRSRLVAVQVRAKLSNLQLVAEGDAQLGQIDRQQRITQLTTKSNRMLPAARSVSGSNPAGIQVALSNGEQVSEKVSDSTGNRNETTMNERGQVVTVKVDVEYHLSYEDRRVDRNGGFQVAAKDTGSTHGTAYLTMFRHEYNALRGKPSTPPPPTVAKGNPHTAGSIPPPNPAGGN